MRTIQADLRADYSGAYQPGTYNFNWQHTNGGRTLSRTDINRSNVQLGSVSYSYDIYGRVSTYYRLDCCYAADACSRAYSLSQLRMLIQAVFTG